MNYELKVNITNNKSAKFHYQVVDENGTIISERKSNREYVACTIHGSFYFGRIDLIGKGEHGRSINNLIYTSLQTESQYNDFLNKHKELIVSYPTYQEHIENSKIRLNKIKTIAYKK